MIYYVDAHCHLDLLKDILQNVRREDSLPIKSISVTNAPFIYEHTRCLFNSSTNIRVALGMHPELVQQYPNELGSLAKWISYTKYIGEIGLDNSSRFKDSFELQKKLFSEILTLCKETDKKILTVHTRSAAKEAIDILNYNLKNSSCKIILHWYSGSAIDLRKALTHGFYFSINHKMVSTEKGKEICKAIPNDFLLTETDAPFTFDSKINNRLASIQQTIKSLSLIKQVSEERMKEIIYSNFANMLKSISN